MPAKPYDARRPSVYLDLPTLRGAYEGVRSPELARLFPWIERAGAEANLCLSINHVGEMSACEDRGRMDDLARWLDRLPVVWVRAGADVQRDEVEHWLKVAAGITPREPFLPFATSLPTSVAFIDNAASVELPICSTVVEQLRAVRRVGWPRFQQGVFEASSGVRRPWRAATRDELLGEARAKLDALERDERLRALAGAAHDRLVLRADPAYRQTGTDRRAAADLLLACCRREPAAVPGVRMAQAFDVDPCLAGPGSSGAARRESDSLTARMHAVVGGVYCDVVAIARPWPAGASAARAATGRAAALALVDHLDGAHGFAHDPLATLPADRSATRVGARVRRRRVARMIDAR